jgi:hypothetical protein
MRYFHFSAHEQFPPDDPLRQAVEAEQASFDGIDCRPPGATLGASLDLAGAGVTLQPGRTYHYRVLVARRVQTEDTIEWETPTVYGADQTFTTAPDPAPSSSQPSAAEGQSPAIQSPPSAMASHRGRHHRKKHKRRQHRANLDRGNRAD